MDQPAQESNLLGAWGSKSVQFMAMCKAIESFSSPKSPPFFQILSVDPAVYSRSGP